MIESLKHIIDKYPVLQKPAYMLFTAAMGFKNLVYSNAFRRFGYLPRRLSDRGQDRWVIEAVFKGRRAGRLRWL